MSEDRDGSLFSEADRSSFKSYLKLSFKIEEYADERLLPRVKAFSYDIHRKAEDIRLGRMHNHLINNYVIGNKKALFSSIKNYYDSQQKDAFTVLPRTYHIKEGIEDAKFFEFMRYFHRRNKEIRRNSESSRNVWIVKPGENSNRGHGIKLCFSLDEIKRIIRGRNTWSDGSNKTYIIQSYIERPFLYHKRKVDIRHFMLITCVNGCLKGYWYRDGYLRTTASEYSLNKSEEAVHLTNDAVQKQYPEYGKYEKGNKLSYEQIDKYIAKKHPGKGFFQNVYPRMRVPIL